MLNNQKAINFLCDEILKNMGFLLNLINFSSLRGQIAIVKSTF